MCEPGLADASVPPLSRSWCSPKSTEEEMLTPLLSAKTLCPCRSSSVSELGYSHPAGCHTLSCAAHLQRSLVQPVQHLWVLQGCSLLRIAVTVSIPVADKSLPAFTQESVTAALRPVCTSCKVNQRQLRSNL